jgi:hypothetical protein
MRTVRYAALNCSRKLSEYILRLSLYRRHPLGSRPCCVAHAMDQMREGRDSRLPGQGSKPQRWRSSRPSCGKIDDPEHEGAAGGVALYRSERAYFCVQNLLIFQDDPGVSHQQYRCLLNLG